MRDLIEANNVFLDFFVNFAFGSAQRDIFQAVYPGQRKSNI